MEYRAECSDHHRSLGKAQMRVQVHSVELPSLVPFLQLVPVTDSAEWGLQRCRFLEARSGRSAAWIHPGQEPGGESHEQVVVGPTRKPVLHTVVGGTKVDVVTL